MALNRTIVVVTRHSNGAYAATYLYPSDFENDRFAPIINIVGPNTTATDLFLPNGSELPTGGVMKVYKIKDQS